MRVQITAHFGSRRQSEVQEWMSARVAKVAMSRSLPSRDGSVVAPRSAVR
jgi:hypothetical protein